MTKKWRRILTLSLSFTFVLSTASAEVQIQKTRRSWEKINVPGAKCGDGSQYSVFVSRGDPEKVAFDFMGGGACWGFATCFGPSPKAWIHSIPIVLESSGIASLDPEDSPISDFTLVYLPYCTGDVHVGTHTAKYGIGFKVHHFGATNVDRMVESLKTSLNLDTEHAKSLVVYGYSAGAVGALYHAEKIGKAFPKATRKVLIADAPGLHFGNDMWDKFTPELFNDFKRATVALGAELKKGEGNIAYLVPAICKQLSKWRVGILQGSRDIVMSQIFGEISGDEHEKLVYGPNGIFELTKDNTDQCISWVPASAQHTFLVTNSTSGIETEDHMSAKDFSFSLMTRGESDNHR